MEYGLLVMFEEVGSFDCILDYFVLVDFGIGVWKWVRIVYGEVVVGKLYIIFI